MPKGWRLRASKRARVRWAGLHVEAVLNVEGREQGLVVEALHLVSGGRLGAEALLETCVQAFFVRGTVVADTDSFMLDGTGDVSDGEVLEAFLAQFYESATYVPRTLLLSTVPDDRDDLEIMLRERREHLVFSTRY